MFHSSRKLPALLHEPSITRRCIFSIHSHYSHEHFITLKVTISRARLDRNHCRAAARWYKRTDAFCSLREIYGWGWHRNQWHEHTRSRKRESFSSSSHNSQEKLGDPSRDEDIGKQHQLLLIAFNWVLNKPQVNNASMVTALPAWKRISLNTAWFFAAPHNSASYTPLSVIPKSQI